MAILWRSRRRLVLQFFFIHHFKISPSIAIKFLTSFHREHRFPPLIIVIVSDCFMGSSDKFSACRYVRARARKRHHLIEQATRVPPLPGVLHNNADAGLFLNPLKLLYFTWKSTKATELLRLLIAR